jgi:hypothetical protein
MKNVRTMTMNKTLLVLIGLTLGAFLQACGTDETPDVTPAKTVNKALLYDKDWNANGATWHAFSTDGTWNGNGTWKWLNDSDSMEVYSDVLGTSVLYFQYIEAKEMQCGTTIPGTVYTSP